MRTTMPAVHPFILAALISMVVLMGGILSPSAATAATYYVATTGNDANSCAQAANISTPKRTINNALNCLVGGDTLYIRGGTYGEVIDVGLGSHLPSSSSWNTATKISAYANESVTLNGSSPNLTQIGIGGSYQYIIFSGLILDGTANRSSISAFGVSLGTGTNYIRIQNGEIKNIGSSGVITYHPGTDFNEFINLNVHHTGQSGEGHGFYIASNNNLISGCDIHDNQKYGVQIYTGYGESINNNVVKGNKFHANGLNPSSGGTLMLSNGDNNQAYNNFIYSNNKDGLSINYNATNSKVYNNTIYSNGYYGIAVGTGSTGAVLKNNIVYQNSLGTIYDSGSGTVQSNNLTTNPSFVNAAALDFHLNAGSAAIDAGTDLSAQGVTTDFDGILRPQGAAYDIGACEFSQTTQIPAPTNLRVVTP